MAQIFENCNIYFTPHNIFPQRSALLQKVITKHGESVAATVENATYIVFGEDLHEKNKSLNFVLNLLNVNDISSSATVLSVAWICQCLKQKSRISTEPFKFKAEIPDIDTTGSPSQRCSSPALPWIILSIMELRHVQNNLAAHEQKKESYKLTKNGYKLHDDGWLRHMSNLRGGFFSTGVVPKYPGTNEWRHLKLWINGPFSLEFNFYLRST